ncbi:hypothetical protein HPO_17711 [Hyphomonas polymorpha PS728]|uniref:DUF805 domain-containing protein n=1 Tax=Hyphomonas polymorpha PS728 TaxID=1280954 RepID=A0A062VC05_9PROT|nr:MULTISPECIES: DUF805 domain-containing protein [Hyphomonas]AXE63440.1 hypothetical protein BBF93_03795 [Hyphomonas sp. CACIAM 19H1]KCZ96859.1 hypothetical protein HPO_17711 [Hyphomonas polymorpha PS728]
MELYLSPNGRIDQPTYWRAVIILFGISAVLNVISAFVSPFLGFVGILFIWPWIAVHVKRFHDAGKTGWLTVAMVLLAIVVSFVLAAFLPGLFGVDQAALQADMERQIEQAAASGNPAAAMSVAMEASKAAAQAQLIPSLVSSLIVTGVVGAVMGLFKTDPNDNQYGPGPAGASSTFV